MTELSEHALQGVWGVGRWEGSMCTWLVVYNNNVCVVTEAVTVVMYSVYKSYGVYLLKKHAFFACLQITHNSNDVSILT